MAHRNARPYILGLILAIWLVGGVLILTSTKAYAADETRKTDLYSNLQLFNEVLIKLKQNYVNDLDDEELIKSAINGMLDSADPHTSYFTADEFTDFTTSTKGEFGGLGIQIDKKGDYITVVSPIEGTPAYRMGLTAGDRIVKVGGVNIVASSTDEAIKKMRGPVGTKVTLTISRPGTKDLMDFEITRETIKIKSVPYSFKLDNGVGYIRISQFSENTDSELKAALDSLETQGIRGLIIDLRFNPGGLLDQAIDTVNEFIGPNKLVVETKGGCKIPIGNTLQDLTEHPKPTRLWFWSMKLLPVLQRYLPALCRIGMQAWLRGKHLLAKAPCNSFSLFLTETASKLPLHIITSSPVVVFIKRLMTRFCAGKK